MNTSTIASSNGAGWLRSRIAIAGGLLIAALAICLMIWPPNGIVPATRNSPAAGVEVYTPLDQHERHAASVPTNLYTPLDQHERHPAGFLNSYIPLDQHERHPAGR